MALNTRQVSFYMAQRNKGLTQEAAAATAGISVRSGRRIEKGQWQSSGERHWRTRQDPLETVWLMMCFLYSLPVRRSRRQRFSNICRINIRASIPIRCAGRCSAVSVPGKPATVRNGRSCSARSIYRECGRCQILPS